MCEEAMASPSVLAEVLYFSAFCRSALCRWHWPERPLLLLVHPGTQHVPSYRSQYRL